MLDSKSVLNKSSFQDRISVTVWYNAKKVNEVHPSLCNTFSCGYSPKHHVVNEKSFHSWCCVAFVAECQLVRCEHFNLYFATFVNCSWWTRVFHSFAVHFAKQCTSRSTHDEWIPAKHEHITRNSEINITTQTDKFVITLQTCAPRETLWTYRKYFVNFFALYRILEYGWSNIICDLIELSHLDTNFKVWNLETNQNLESNCLAKICT